MLDRLHELPRQRAGRLRRALMRASALDRTGRLFLVRTPMDVAACERLLDRATMLVYDIRPVNDLHRALLGSEIHAAVRRRAMGRLSHSRRY